MGARKLSCGGHFRAWMYEDRRVKEHHVQFESRDRREWWGWERENHPHQLGPATSGTFNSVPFDG